MKYDNAQPLCTQETPNTWTPSRYTLQDQNQYREFFQTQPFDASLHEFFLSEKRRENREAYEQRKHLTSWPKEDIPGTSPDPCMDYVLANETRQEVQDLLTHVSAPSRNRLLSHVLDHKKYKEIALSEGKATTTIRNSVQQTEKKLKDTYLAVHKENH